MQNGKVHVLIMQMNEFHWQIIMSTTVKNGPKIFDYMTKTIKIICVWHSVNGQFLGHV